MKANEVMIGDIVTFRDCLEDDYIMPVRIWQINADGEALVSIDGDEALDEIGFDDEIVGIPLTNKILHKNGFIYNHSPFVQGYEQFGLLIYNGRINCGNNISLKVEYVHELQHVLKLCGIDKIIEL